MVMVALHAGTFKVFPAAIPYGFLNHATFQKKRQGAIHGISRYSKALAFDDFIKFVCIKMKLQA
jgi:hypothetical protein